MTKSNSKLGEKKEGAKGEVRRTPVMLRQPVMLRFSSLAWRLTLPFPTQ